MFKRLCSSSECSQDSYVAPLQNVQTTLMMLFFFRIFKSPLCCPSAKASKDPNGIPPLVSHVFVEGENAKECKKDSGSTKKMPNVMPVKEVQELTGLVHLS